MQNKTEFILLIKTTNIVSTDIVYPQNLKLLVSKKTHANEYTRSSYHLYQLTLATGWLDVSSPFNSCGTSSLQHFRNSPVIHMYGPLFHLVEIQHLHMLCYSPVRYLHSLVFYII